MTLELSRGAHLKTAEGDDLGKVQEFVVDPARADLTHVIVEKGMFFADDTVVPIEAIDQVEDDTVVLSDHVDPAGLPKFVLEHYSQVDPQTQSRFTGPQQADYMWRYPTAYGVPFPPYPVYPMPVGSPTRHTVNDPVTRNRLAENETIGSDTPVLSIEGEKVGKVSEMHVDDEGELSHLVVDLGLFSEEKVLPAHWIDSIASNSVRLAVGEEALERLETNT